MNPNYIDSYAALFDVYFWTDRSKEALELIEQVEQNSSSAHEIADKIERARKQAETSPIDPQGGTSNKQEENKKVASIEK